MRSNADACGQHPDFRYAERQGQLSYLAKRGCKYKYFFILLILLFLFSYYFYIASDVKKLK
jgi:hypothetical protein